MSATTIPFTRIPDSVLLDPRLTAVQLRIYAVIARRLGSDTASAFPSYATIARDANTSRTSAISAVKALIELGYLCKQAQPSGQGDLTSNRYTICGEGSQIYAPRGAIAVPPLVHGLDHGSKDPALPVVQILNHGGADFGPEPESKNQTQRNKTQEIQNAREPAPAPASADPELQSVLSDYQENIGALTAMAMQVVTDLVKDCGSGWVRDAIQEAVIYEKRSLAYVRRILRAWKQTGRAGERKILPIRFEPIPVPQSEAAHTATDIVWPPPDLVRDAGAAPNRSDPAAVAWRTICDRMPQLGRLSRMATAVSLEDGVLTIEVGDPRTYSVLTSTQRHLVAFASREVLGNEGSVAVTKVEHRLGAAGC
ncbi:MAG: primosome, DnaD subunit [Chloroflexi bacterium OLB13]|nr:MAG: primosome, DnaD subunit [Chloroflexi bacterium OLB13]